MPGGRPTDYHGEETIAKVKEYLSSCVDEEREIINGDRLTSRKIVHLPKKAGLALYLEISRDTIEEWCKKYKEFSDVIDELQAKQEEVLINNGLSGDYNSTITKLILHKHNYHEKVDTDVTSGGDKIIPLIIQRGEGRTEDNSTSETV